MNARAPSRLDAITPAAVSWVAFFLLISAAWLALLAAAAADGAPSALAALSPEALLSLCRAGVGADAAGWPSAFAMWSLMALAMMAPTAAPLLAAWREIESTRPDRVAPMCFWALTGGYLLVWLGFAAVAAALQIAIAATGGLSASQQLTNGHAAAGVLGIAGVYQFSALKGACLAKCRAPFAFLLAHWRPGMRAAMAIGVRHGMICLGCCWALMLLGFVAGTMNLVWMGLAMALMIAEKLPGLGRHVTAPLGVGLILAAIAVAIQSL